MKIAIVGAGNVGGTLGRRWSERGHEVVWGVREPSGEKMRSLLSRAGSARAATVREAVAQCDVVVLSTPWPATEQALKDMGDLTGKTLIDCTNPLAGDLSGLVIGHTDSAAETIARWAPGAHVVKAFNTTGAPNLENPKYQGRGLPMLLCGDDSGAKKTVSDLAADLGFEPMDAGNLKTARLLEPFAMLWIHLAYGRGLGTDFAFTISRR